MRSKTIFLGLSVLAAATLTADAEQDRRDDIKEQNQRLIDKENAEKEYQRKQLQKQQDEKRYQQKKLDEERQRRIDDERRNR